MDHGPQEIRWVGQRHVSSEELAMNVRLRPIRIQKGVLKNSRKLLVSRQHGVLLDNNRFARAIYLAKVMQGVGPLNNFSPVTYYHLLFDTHEIVLAEGIPTESFYPGSMALAMMGPRSMRAVRNIVPKLPDDLSDKRLVEDAYGPPAREYQSKQDVFAWAQQPSGFSTALIQDIAGNQ